MCILLCNYSVDAIKYLICVFLCLSREDYNHYIPPLRHSIDRLVMQSALF